MCKTFGKLVYKLWKVSGKCWFGLVEKFWLLASMCKNNLYSTKFYQNFTQDSLKDQPHKISGFSPLSTPLTVTTKLNEGVI
jgi:hypothetical protein